MSETIDTPKLGEKARANLATKLLYEHEERMAQAARSSEPSVSVELGANAKRETIPNVKIYAPLGCDEEALREHAEMVTRLTIAQYETTIQRFPAASGYVTNDGK